MNNDEELVVLVDETDTPIGTMRKSEVHTDKTPLHRGLSVFIFNDNGQVMVQQRAMHKKTWPGVWSNSCCGHPGPGEGYREAAIREVKEELGVEVEELVKVSDYRYRFSRNGVVENEICPVFAGKAVGEVKLDPGEVMDYRWMEWEDFRDELKKDKAGAWSEWCKEEVELVEKFRQGEH
jgi:isopentenyl-diphosphate delta-isomerase